MQGVGRVLRGISIATLALGYVLLAHYTNVTAGMETVGTVVALAPILLAAWSLAWRSPHRRLLLPAFGLACAGMLMVWKMVEHSYSHIYWAEHAGTQFFLCMMFGRTLQSGREPICTYFAGLVHGPLTPMMQRYTRQVTIAWVIFFGTMSAASTILFFAATLPTWSIFANFFTGPLIGSMFVAEYIVRRLLHPDMEHAHFLDAIKVFWKAPAA